MLVVVKKNGKEWYIASSMGWLTTEWYKTKITRSVATKSTGFEHPTDQYSKMIKKWQSSITYIFLIFYKQLRSSWYTPSIQISPASSLFFWSQTCSSTNIWRGWEPGKNLWCWLVTQIYQSAYLVSPPTWWGRWQPVRCAPAARVGITIFIAPPTTISTSWPCFMLRTGSINRAICCRIEGRFPVLTRLARRPWALCK